MKAEITALCDAASTSSGKLNILGAFDLIKVEKMPAIHPIAALALRLKASKDEFGTYKFDVKLIDPNEIEILKPVDDEITFKSEDLFFIQNIVIWLQNLKLESIGLYKFIINIDGKEITNCEFRVSSIDNYK